MTTDIRSRLVNRLKAVLDAKTANLPDSIPIAVPVGPLVDAVIEEMANGRGIPVIPDWDDEVAQARRWTEPFSTDAVMEGDQVRTISAYLDRETRDMVGLFVQQGRDEVIVELPLDDAEEYAMWILAAVRAGRSGLPPVADPELVAATQIDEPSERG